MTTINLYGCNVDCTFDDVGVDYIDEFYSVFSPEYTNTCAPLEPPVLVKKGRCYSILNPAQKFIPLIISNKVGKFRCAILKNINSTNEDTLRLLLATVPSTPLLYDLSHSAELIQSYSYALDWLKKPLCSLLHFNARNPALLRNVFGEGGRCTKTYSNHNPYKYKEEIDHWNKRVSDTGGFSYVQILLRGKDKKKQKAFPGIIKKHIKEGTFDGYFDRVQSSAQKLGKEGS